ncbi:putative Rhomboid-like superfamily protein [Helianthus annuus]|nr:putative Rhomboid-like superfamily protein [Helianthus annuus]
MGRMAVPWPLTIPYGWNLLTASYIEQTIQGVVISTIGLLFIGRLLEPIWGSKEFLKFIFVVNFFTNVCVFITVISVYYITMEEIYIYMPLSGFGGALSGLLVGVKQIIPDQELSPLQIKAKVSNINDDVDDDHEEIGVIHLSFLWVPSIVIFLSIGLSFFTTELTTYLPILIFGTYIGWIYLRYFQRKQETKIKGDPSDQFSFSTFFPEFLRPLIDPVASIFDQMLCGRSKASIETRGYTVGTTALLPGSDPIEASRRRERGARALEERLAAERLASLGSKAEPNRDHATEKV